MPAHSLMVPIAADIARVWSFVDDYGNWAPLFPGYQSHRLMENGGSVWRIRGDVGMFTRVVEIAVAIVSREEGRRVGFTVKGLYESVRGEGSFEARTLGPGRAELTFAIDLQAGGPMAPMVNGVLKGSLPRMMADFGRALAERIGAA